jgi:hypothetical protein
LSSPIFKGGAAGAGAGADWAASAPASRNSDVTVSLRMMNLVLLMGLFE